MGDYSSGREENQQYGTMQVTGTRSSAFWWEGLLWRLVEGDETSVPWNVLQPHPCLKQLCHGAPPNPASPQNTAHACRVIAGATYGPSCDEVYANSKQHTVIASPQRYPLWHLPSELLWETMNSMQARQLTLLVPGGPPIAAAVREATFPSLTLHSLSPSFFLCFPLITIVPAWLFLLAKFPGMKWTGFVARKLSTAVEIWTKLSQSSSCWKHCNSLMSENIKYIPLNIELL